MSLLQKASIITTPTAYAEDYLYSIKPALKVSDTEIITNGDFSNGLTNWTASTSPPTLNADNTVTFDSSTEFIFQSISKTVGRRYRLTFDGTGNLRYRTGFAGTDAPTKEIVLPAVIDIVATSDTNRVQPYGSTLGTGILKSISLKEITDADFDFDRNSTGTRVNEDYLIEDVPYNLAKYSEDFTDSSFSKINATVTANQVLAPDGTLTADKIVFDGTANARVEQNLSATIINTNYSAGSVNTQSVFLKTESGTANIDIGLAGHDTTTVIVTSEWKRFTHTGTGTFPRMKSDSAVTIFAWGFQVVAGNEQKDYLKTTDRLDIPRIDYTNGEPSILLEPSRTNNVTNSNSSFTANKTTITYNNINSPEGIQNAFKVECSSSGTAVFARTASISFTDATFSLFVKYGNTQYLQFLTTNTGAHFFNFDVKNGVFGTKGASTSNLKAVEYPNGWYRVSGYFTGGSGTGSFRVYLSNSNSAAYGAASATSGDFLYSYGWQVENGSYATSLIHTSGSAVTRSADAANNAGNSDLISSTEGVLYVEMKALANDSTNRNITLSDGTTTNRIVLKYDNSSNVIQCFNRVAGVETASLTNTVVDITEFKKIAVKYKVNDYALYIDGKEVDTDTTSTTFSASTLNDLSLTPDLHAQVKSVMVFKEPLTDLELEKLTGYNNHELYMNYYNRLSYLGLAEEYNVESDINNYIL